MLSALTLDQLRTLVAVADAGSFSEAGRRLGRAQSAVSQAVATLEAKQGVTLFDRSSYRPRLTKAGRTLTDQARIVLRGVARFEAIAAQVSDGIEAELTLAIDPLVPSAPLVDALREVGAAYPDLPISFSTEALGGSLRRLRDGTAAIGLCTLLPIVPDDVVATPLARTRMRAVVAASHPLAKLGRPARPEDLEPFVQLVLSDPVEPAIGNYGLIGARRWRFADLNRRMEFLQGGFGWCRMPDHLVATALEDGRLVALVLERDTAPPEGLVIYAAHLWDRPPGPAGQRLLEIAKRRIGLEAGSSTRWT
ncbi:MAG: LysR family transcriptional regulator [Pseudomonadota bacterium]